MLDVGSETKHERLTNAALFWWLPLVVGVLSTCSLNVLEVPVGRRGGSVERVRDDANQMQKNKDPNLLVDSLLSYTVSMF